MSKTKPISMRIDTPPKEWTLIRFYDREGRMLLLDTRYSSYKVSELKAEMFLWVHHTGVIPETHLLFAWKLDPVNPTIINPADRLAMTLEKMLKVKTIITAPYIH